MASVYCHRCSKSHPRPTGRNYRRPLPAEVSDTVNATPSIITTPDPVDHNTHVIAMLSSIQQSLGSLTSRVPELEVDNDESPVTNTHDVFPSMTYRPTDVSMVPPMPSLAMLRGSTDIQHQVNDRLHELHVRGTSGTVILETNINNHSTKSGRYRGAESATREHVYWPHEMVYVGAERHTASYDDLSPEQFIPICIIS